MSFFTASLFAFAVVFVSLVNSQCDQSPYNVYVYYLANYRPALDYCTANYPLPTATSTTTVTRVFTEYTTIATEQYITRTTTTSTFHPQIIPYATTLPVPKKKRRFSNPDLFKRQATITSTAKTKTTTKAKTKTTTTSVPLGLSRSHFRTPLRRCLPYSHVAVLSSPRGSTSCTYSAACLSPFSSFLVFGFRAFSLDTSLFTIELKVE